MRGSSHSVLALDIGGTTIKGAVFDRSGSQTPTRAHQTFLGNDTPYDRVIELLTMLLDESLDSGQLPSAIGIGTPGLVHPTSGTVKYAANLNWRDLPLKALIEERFGLPVAVDHDARAAARAEMDARPGAHDLVFVPIGTGISAAIASGGRLITGATGATGEFGHMTVIPGGESCSCGQHGCLEAYASAGSIVRRFTERAKVPVINAAEVAALIATDPVAEAVWKEAVNALAGGLCALTAILDPQEIIIGGGLACAGESLLTPLRRGVEERLAWRAPPIISRSKIGQRAGLVGAGLLAWELAGCLQNDPSAADR